MFSIGKWPMVPQGTDRLSIFQLKGLILAQNERWRRGLGMQVARQAVLLAERWRSGVRESNAWVINPQDRDSGGKLPVIPDNVSGPNGAIPPEDEPASY